MKQTYLKKKKHLIQMVTPAGNWTDKCCEAEPND